MNHTHFATLSLPAGAMALRALRPSMRSVRLPVRYVSAPLFQGLPYDSPLWQLREVPVYVRKAKMSTSQRVKH
jgi:hypothetical protein